MDLDAPFREALEGVAKSLAAELGEERLAAAGDDLERIFAESVERAIPVVARELADDLKRAGPDMLVERHSDRNATEERLAERWGRAFDLMEMAIVAAYEAGEAFNAKHQTAAGEDNDLVFAALVRLHARACRIAEEVLSLLKGGYGQGAHARWRALHEVAVNAAFLRKHGQDTAERYFLHEAVESWRVVIEYQRYAERLGYRPYTDDEVRDAEETVECLCERYGKAYLGTYGWAHAAFAADEMQLPRKPPTLSDIERDVELDHMRPWYRMASHPTHANPKGITFTPDVLPSRPVLLAGPGATGLAAAGECALVSLCQVSATLVTYKFGESAPLILGALMHVSDEGQEAFASTQRAVRAADSKAA